MRPERALLQVGPDGRIAPVPHLLTDGDGNVVLFREEAESRLGVNTDAPQTPLHVRGTLRVEDGALDVRGYATNVRLEAGWDHTSRILGGAGAADTDAHLWFGRYGDHTAPVRITAASNLVRLYADSGDVELHLEADTRNVDELANPKITLTQDGGLVGARIGFGETDIATRTDVMGNDFAIVDIRAPDRVLIGANLINDTQRRVVSVGGPINPVPQEAVQIRNHFDVYDERAYHTAWLDKGGNRVAGIKRDGTVVAGGGYSFMGDLDTGLYNVADDQIGLFVGGLRVARAIGYEYAGYGVFSVEGGLDVTSGNRTALILLYRTSSLDIVFHHRGVNQKWSVGNFAPGELWFNYLGNTWTRDPVLKLRPDKRAIFLGNMISIARPYTPASADDDSGWEGALAWDDDHFYVRTSAGWKKVALMPL